MIWKVSHVIMIHKNGKPLNEISSYRLINLPPILSKLLEKLLQSRILPLLKQSHVIPDHQFGFRQEHLTIEQIYRVGNHITEKTQKL